MKKIRLFKPSLGINELKSVKRVFKKSWIGQGNEVLLFEKKFKNKFKSKYALAFNSFSAALQLAVDSLKLPKGSKIMVNNLTFAASIQCILHNKHIPVLIDCDKKTLGFNLEDAKKKITKNVRAIIVVHYGGYPSKIDKIVKFAKKNRLKVIEDCAHAQGSLYKNKYLGTWGDIGCYSFEEKKGITTGDGGMLITNNLKIYNEIKL
jgi:perosamine synthetase